MNDLLQRYCADVEFPEVRGAEHLEMLHTRDRLAEMEGHLSAEEREQLHAADRRRARQAPAFHAELSRFIDLAQHRLIHQIAPSRWWWHLTGDIEVPPPAPESRA